LLACDLNLLEATLANPTFLAKCLIIIALWNHLSQDNALAQNYEIDRIFLDLTARRPSAQEKAGIITRLAAASSLTERKLVFRNLIFGQLMGKGDFRDRLYHYFSGLMGMSQKFGDLSVPCQVSGEPECQTLQAKLDFADEPAMMLAMLIAEGVRSETYTGHDIRLALNSSVTVMTGAMASFVLEKSGSLERLGLGNVNRETLQEVAAKPDGWHWLNRDPAEAGLESSLMDYRERHAGILTTPAFLQRNNSHLSRAYGLYHWFMCKTLEQTPQEESPEVKLISKTPCAGCHSVLEPLGSFWIHWRSKIISRNAQQLFILDGVERLDAEDNVLPESGSLPLDAQHADLPHSRALIGQYRDFKGMGPRAIAEYVVNQREFSSCMAEHAIQFMYGRKLDPSERGYSNILGDRLAKDYDWDLREVIVDIVLNQNYTDDGTVSGGEL
jgi:hypothetical protein